MSQSHTARLLAFSSSVVGCLLLAGCTFYSRPLTFKIIDADTGQPLEGVEVAYRGTSNLMSYRPELKGRLPDPGPDGILRTGKLDEDYNYEFDFKKTGYRTSGAFFSPTRRDEIDIPLPPSHPDYGRKAATINSKGVIVIPMYREPPATRPSRATTGRT